MIWYSYIKTLHEDMSHLIKDMPCNTLPPLPVAHSALETVPVLRQVTRWAIALAELKGLAHTLPNPSILLNAVILKEKPGQVRRLKIWLPRTTNSIRHYLPGG